jgi:hypothetical protein
MQTRMLGRSTYLGVNEKHEASILWFLKKLEGVSQFCRFDGEKK